jgi:hypothetical protein
MATQNPFGNDNQKGHGDSQHAARAFSPLRSGDWHLGRCPKARVARAFTPQQMTSSDATANDNAANGSVAKRGGGPVGLRLEGMMAGG